MFVVYERGGRYRLTFDTTGAGHADQIPNALTAMGFSDIEKGPAAPPLVSYDATARESSSGEFKPMQFLDVGTLVAVTRIRDRLSRWAGYALTVGAAAACWGLVVRALR